MKICSNCKTRLDDLAVGCSYCGKELPFPDKGPENCPTCNAKLNKKPVVYGMPSEEMFKDKNIILGGCCIVPGQPNYALVCPKCERTGVRYYIRETHAK